MQTPGQRFTELFYDWEQYGRGWLLADRPVEPEPPYLPFWAHLKSAGIGTSPIRDDGRSPGLSGLVKGLFRKKEATPELPTYDRSPVSLEIDAIPCAFGLVFPRNYKPRLDEIEGLLLMLSETTFPLSFEIIGDGERIVMQFTAQSRDAAYLEGQLKAFFPEAIIRHQDAYLISRWPASALGEPAIIDLGLSQEFMRPLAIPKGFQPDPLLGLVGILEGLGQDELGILQVIFQGAINPWAQTIMASVSDASGKSLFDNDPNMPKLAEAKVSKPLFGVVARLIGFGNSDYRSEEIVRQMIRSLRPLEEYGSNSLEPIPNEDYPAEQHALNVLHRSSNRLGMILNSGELAGLVHPLDASVQASKLRGQEKKSHPAPILSKGADYHLGTNIHHGIESPVAIDTETRLRHLHIIGATGTGKSTLIRSLIQQDLEAGHGFAILDPHGDLIEQILERIPPSRYQNVVVIDPADADYPVGINLLQANSEIEKIVLSSDLVSVFRRMATSWGDQMSTVLANAINAFLESSKGGTILELKRFLVEQEFRTEFLETVEDEEVVYFWEQEFPLLKGNTIASLLTRLNTFLRPKPIRNMMGQAEGLDFRQLMDDGKVILVKLSQGVIGADNSYLLGTLLVAKLHQAAQGRQQQRRDSRKPFFLYIDEFQHFVTPSMSHILSGARKYGLGLVLAHQSLEQLKSGEAEVASAVLANAGTRISFRLGDTDARKLESSFVHFEAKDLQSLAMGEAIVRIGQADQDCNINTSMLPDVPEAEAERVSQSVIEASRNQYAGTPLAKTAKKKPSPEKPAETTPPIQEPDPVPEPVPKKEEPKPDVPLSDIEATKEYLAKQERQKEHKRTQMLVKKLAEARGFKAVLEAPVGDGRVDVLLSYDKVQIGVEVSVTNTVAYEVQNIEKCLGAKLDTVLMLSKDAKHLVAIETAAKAKLSKADFAKTAYLHPDQLAGMLNTISAEFSQTETRVKGYKVKVRYADSEGSSDAASRISRILLRSVQRKPKSD